MSKKRKISIRKVIQVLLTLIVSSGCVVAILSASKIESKQRLNGIEMQISDDNAYHFLDKNELLKIITENKNTDQVAVGRLNISTVEDTMLSNPWIADAQVYVDNNRLMHISIAQRIPVVRIFETNGSSYYLDSSLRQVPLSARFVCYTHTITNVPHLSDDSMGRSTKAQIVALATHIQKDSFWNAMVSQIMMDSVYGFELLPVLGNHTIMLGDTLGMTQKLNNVFLFYKKILNNIGWDKYETLDVRFKGQLVASPALPWKAPTGKTVSNMDWVKSIMNQGAKEDGADSSAKQTIADKPLANVKITQAKPPPKSVKPENKKDVKPNKKADNKKDNHLHNKKRAI